MQEVHHAFVMLPALRKQVCRPKQDKTNSTFTFLFFSFFLCFLLFFLHQPRVAKRFLLKRSAILEASSTDAECGVRFLFWSELRGKRCKCHRPLHVNHDMRLQADTLRRTRAERTSPAAHHRMLHILHSDIYISFHVMAGAYGPSGICQYCAGRRGSFDPLTRRSVGVPASPCVLQIRALTTTTTTAPVGA